MAENTASTRNDHCYQIYYPIIASD